MLEHHDVSAVYDDGPLHVLLSPPGTWVSLDGTGAEVGRQQATRAEVMTVQLRASPLWASMRRLLQERGVDSPTSVLGDSFDDEDVDVGVLVTAGGPSFRGVAATTMSGARTTVSSGGRTSPTRGEPAPGARPWSQRSSCRRTGWRGCGPLVVADSRYSKTFRRAASAGPLGRRMEAGAAGGLRLGGRAAAEPEVD
jgi:hypothetical protein